MSYLEISNIRELDMDEIQQVSGGIYIPIGPTFGALGSSLGLGALATQNSYPNLSSSLAWGGGIFSAIGAWFSF